MKLQQRGTIAVAIIFVLLAALVYLLEMRDRGEAPAEEGKVPVFSFQVEDVVLLEVTDGVSGQKVRVGTSPDERWTMLDPFEAEADDVRIEGLLSRLSELQSSRVLEDEELDLEAFGLSVPTLEVKVGLEDGGSQVLLIGRENPAGYSHYARRDGAEAVYLVASSTISELERLVREPPEKPTPMPTETLIPTIVASPTVPVTGGDTPTSALTAEPTATLGR